MLLEVVHLHHHAFDLLVELQVSKVDLLDWKGCRIFVPRPVSDQICVFVRRVDILEEQEKGVLLALSELLQDYVPISTPYPVQAALSQAKERVPEAAFGHLAQKTLHSVEELATCCVEGHLDLISGRVSMVFGQH